MKHVYLLVGESFLVDEALAKIRKETGSDPLSEVRLDSDSDVPEILNALETPTLLGGPRLVIVDGAEGLRKEAVEEIERFVDSPSSESVLVLIATRKTALARLIEKKGDVVTLDPPKGRSLVAWLRRRAADRSLRLDDRAGWALLDSVGPELRDLDVALEQLATQLDRGAAVGPVEIQRAFPRLADERMYAFTDAVGERRLPQAMTALRRLLDQEDIPLVVFGALSSHLRRLLIARSYSEGGPRAVGEALGLPEWRARRVHQQAKAFRLEELRDAMQVLARTDLEIKGGDLSPEVALELAVVEIVSARAPS